MLRNSLLCKIYLSVCHLGKMKKKISKATLNRIQMSMFLLLRCTEDDFQASRNCLLKQKVTKAHNLLVLLTLHLDEVVHVHGGRSARVRGSRAEWVVSSSRRHPRPSVPAAPHRRNCNIQRRAILSFLCFLFLFFPISFGMALLLKFAISQGLTVEGRHVQLALGKCSVQHCLRI